MAQLIIIGHIINLCVLHLTERNCLRKGLQKLDLICLDIKQGFWYSGKVLELLTTLSVMRF